MNRAYAAALGDYPRRVRFPVTMVLSVLFLLPLLKGYVERAEWAGEYGLLMGTLVLVIWTGLVSGHLKQVLARPQGRLLPGYARTQIGVALALLLPAILICVAGALLARFSVPAALAMALSLTCFYWSWPYLFDRGNMLMLFGPSLVWWVSAVRNNPELHPGQISWARWLPENMWFALAIVLSLVVIAFVTRRMLRLTESSFEYGKDPSIAWRAGSSPDSDAPFMGFFRRLLPWLGHYRIGPRHSIYGASTWERVGHWRRGMGPRSPMVTGLSMAAMVALVGCYFLLYDEKSPLAELGILLTYLFIFPFSRYSYTHRRRSRLQTEALLPAKQSRFVREMGWATSIDILETWLFLALGTLAARGLGLFTTVAWGSFPYLLALSLGTTIFGIGLVPWILRLNGDKWPSIFLSFFVLGVGGLIALFLRKIAGFGMPGVWASAVVILAAIGVLGARQGYRLWCNLELGRESF